MSAKLKRIAALNAIDLALESQRFEAEVEELVDQLLPLLDGVERLCRDLDRQSAEAVNDRKEALALLAEIGDKAAAGMGLERIGKPGELSMPEMHEVIDTDTCSGEPHGTVVDIIRFGWRFRGRVLRQAKVIAAANS